jgi:uncharacterized protein (TIGR03000 family)
MYSVVLMAALTTSPAVPEFGRRGRGCWGGSSCCGCYGGGYGYGCSGGGYGCSGGGYGCSGCWGGYGYGCWGGGGGCYGYPAYVSYGCSGYFGGCYGGYYGGGGYGGYAPAYISPSGATRGTRPAERVPAPDKGTTGKTGDQTASIRVTVPAGAKLYVDGKLTETRGSSQTFSTPTLNAGQLYAYTFRAEVERNGQTQTDTQRVLFRPGETVRVSFPGLTGSTPTTQTTRR